MREKHAGHEGERLHVAEARIVLEEGGDHVATERVVSPGRLEGVLLLVARAAHGGRRHERQQTPQLRQVVATRLGRKLRVPLADFVDAALHTATRE